MLADKNGLTNVAIAIGEKIGGGWGNPNGVGGVPYCTEFHQSATISGG